MVYQCAEQEYELELLIVKAIKKYVLDLVVVEY